MKQRGRVDREWKSARLWHPHTCAPCCSCLPMPACTPQPTHVLPPVVDYERAGGGATLRQEAQALLQPSRVNTCTN